MNQAEYFIKDLWSLIDELNCPTRKNQMRNLFEYLDRFGQLTDIPASCYTHGSYRGGFVDHSVRVTKTALKLHEILLPTLNRDSVVTCALLHDLSKNGFITARGVVSRYQENANFDRRREASAYNKTYNYNPHQPYFPLGISSGIIAAKAIDLTWSEIMAITASDGQYIGENRSFAHRETPLLILITMADNFSGNVLEKGLDPNLFNTPEFIFRNITAGDQDGNPSIDTQAKNGSPLHEVGCRGSDQLPPGHSSPID